MKFYYLIRIESTTQRDIILDYVKSITELKGYLFSTQLAHSDLKHSTQYYVFKIFENIRKYFCKNSKVFELLF